MSRTTIIAARLQPLGLDDERDVADALSQGNVVLVVMDADRPRSVCDPFTYEERATLLARAFPASIASGALKAVPLGSYGYDHEARREAMARIVVAESGESTLLAGFPPEGCDKPAHDGAKAYGDLMAGIANGSADGTSVSGSTALWLSDFAMTAEAIRLDGELAEIMDVRKKYGAGPHLTADAVCTYGDYVLLVTRGNHPFKGLLAIPGGIVDKGEDPLDAASRELLEETCMQHANGTDESTPSNPPKTTLRSETPRIYAASGRDPRGEYVAHAFHNDYSELPERPSVAAGDDAAKADWYHRSTLSPSNLAFDHFAMLHDMIGLPFPEFGPHEENACKP